MIIYGSGEKMLVTEATQLEQIQKEARNSQVVGIDTETNFTDNYRERYLLGLAVKTDDNIWYIPVGHKPYMGFEYTNYTIPENFLESVECPLVAHSMKFDYEVLTRAGLKVPTSNLWDTMMLSVYIDEN